MKFICYPKCSTCKKAQLFLNENAIEYTIQDITQDTPTANDLKTWQSASNLPLRKFFNTSGKLYRELNLKEKLSTMTDDEAFHLLASNGMLIKRPLLVSTDFVLVGFNETQWTETLAIN